MSVGWVVVVVAVSECMDSSTFSPRVSSCDVITYLDIWRIPRTLDIWRIPRTLVLIVR